mgnify:FL=1
MWSWHVFLGCQFGIEWYEAKQSLANSSVGTFSYFIIDIGFVRIQRAERIESE